MKVKVTLSIMCMAFLTLLISSYQDGPAYHAGYECTGATGSRHGCSGSGCHGLTTSNDVAIELDSAGVSVKTYYPGMTYTVKISAVNGTGQNLPYFGFQMATVLSAGAGTGTALQGGTWDSVSLPPGVRYTSTSISGLSIPVVEHSTPIQADSGTGANGTTYYESVNWTAPQGGKGSVILYGALNAVNHDGSHDGDYSYPATPDTISEAIVAGINELTGPINDLKVYPTLMNDNITISFDQPQASAVSAAIVSVDGKVAKTFMSNEQIIGGSFSRCFDVSGLASGIYFFRVQVGSASAVSRVVKE